LKKLFLLTLAAMLTAGCSRGIIRPKVEKGIRNALPGYIGPAKEYSVRAMGPSIRMLRGRINSLHIEGTDVLIAPNLTVCHLSVEMEEVQADTSSRKLKSVRQTTFEAQVEEGAVNYYLNASSPDGDDIGIELEPGKLTVVARPAFHGVGAEIRISGKPHIRNGTEVHFVADSGSLARISVPAWIVNKLLEKVNPVLDLAEMQFPVSLTAVTIRKDRVVITGRADFKP